MAKNPFMKMKVNNDWIMISIVPIQSKHVKEAAKKNIQLVGGMAPKNFMELEKKKQEENLTYADMPEKFKAMWDEHPNQGIVVGVGPKVDPIEGITVGKRICFRGGTGEPVIYNKEFYLMLKPYDLFLTV